MADVKIDGPTMETLNTQLLNIISELEQASSQGEALQAAIDAPYGDTRLRDEVGEFESRWEDKRGELTDSLKKIQEHVQDVIDGFSEGDSEMANSMQEATSDIPV